MNLIVAALVYITPKLIYDGKVPMYYYGIVLIIYCVHQVRFFLDRSGKNPFE